MVKKIKNKIPDIQKEKIQGGKIQKVGIRETYGEVIFKGKIIPANFSMYVSLINSKGIHMSRLPQVLMEHCPLKIEKHFITNTLDAMELKSGDFCDDHYIKMSFNYAREIFSPIKKIKNTMLIPIRIKAKKINNKYEIILEVITPYTSLCPCCFLPKTFVYTATGVKHIKDVIPNKDRTMERKMITNKFIYPSDGKEYVMIKGVGLNPVSCSSDHKILIKKRKNFQWVEANKIRNGDFLVIPKVNSENARYQIMDLTKWKEYYNNKHVNKKIKIDEEMGRFLGLFLAEGSFSAQSICLSFNKKEKELISFTKRILNSRFGIPHLTLSKQKYKGKISNGICLMANRTTLWKAFKNIFGEYSYTKKIPEIILNSPESVIKEFIKGWYEGDGSHTKNRTVQRINTTSFFAAAQLQQLMLQFGMFMSIICIKAKNSNSKLPNGKPAMVHDMYYCNLTLEHLYKLGWEKNKPKNKNPIIKQNKKFFFIPVREVKDLKYKGKVYDLEVKNTKYTIPFLVHNSKEISKYSAHNQKSFATITTIIKDVIIEDLIEKLITITENNASCPISNILKREDEKYVTEKAYENPKFVEDVCRGIGKELDKLLNKEILDYSVVINHEESIHDHIAVAFMHLGKKLR